MSPWVKKARPGTDLGATWRQKRSKTTFDLDLGSIFERFLSDFQRIVDAIVQNFNTISA